MFFLDFLDSAFDEKKRKSFFLFEYLVIMTVIKGAGAQITAAALRETGRYKRRIFLVGSRADRGDLVQGL